jgi:manganese transport protein
MVTGQAADYFATSNNAFWKIVIIVAGLAFVTLLVIAIIYPLLHRRRKYIPIQLHPEAVSLQTLSLPSYNRIAVALDFSQNDQKLLSHALGQGTSNTSYILIHVVESVPARIYENESDDLETEKDKEHLIFYTEQLKERGIHAEPLMGFGERAKEIVRLVKKGEADMLVIGAHGHAGIKDILYGETINTVRHELKIPVFIVNL